MATEVVDSKQDAVFSVSAKNLDKKDFFGKSDPYFVISKQIREAWITVYRSEVVKACCSGVQLIALLAAVDNVD